jgi:hypothetical protein
MLEDYQNVDSVYGSEEWNKPTDISQVRIALQIYALFRN